MDARGEVTIDELAAAVGMTVRNIRAHQARGLLPPPRIIGRTGYYGLSHRGRLDQTVNSRMRASTWPPSPGRWRGAW